MGQNWAGTKGLIKSKDKTTTVWNSLFTDEHFRGQIFRPLTAPNKGTVEKK